MNRPCGCGCGQAVNHPRSRNLPGHGKRLASRQYVVDPDSGCWVWQLGKNSAGYGALKWHGRSWRAHRLMYMALVGPIPDGLVLDHLCRNKACVNPAHLEVVTQDENWRRGFSPPAQNARKTHCKHGHPLAGENLHISPEGYRYCRICKRNVLNASRKRKRERERQHLQAIGAA